VLKVIVEPEKQGQAQQSGDGNDGFDFLS